MHTSARTRAECSPMPAVKTRASSPPSAAVIAATAPATRYVYTPSASCADSSSEGAASSARRPLPSDRPSRPDSSFRARSTSSTDSPCSRWTKRSAPGSIEPDRVAIGTPSRGEKPIVVSTERPPSYGRHRAATAEVADDQAQISQQRHPEARTPARRTTARTARGSRSAGFPTLRASSAVARRSRPRRGIVVWNEVSKTATCGTLGKARLAASMPASAGAL